MRNADFGLEDGLRIEGSDAFINPQSEIRIRIRRVRIPKSAYCIMRLEV